MTPTVGTTTRLTSPPQRRGGPRLLSRRVVVGLAAVQVLGVGLVLPGMSRGATAGLAVAFPIALVWLGWALTHRSIRPATSAAVRTWTKVMAAGLVAMLSQAFEPRASTLVVLALLAGLAVLAVRQWMPAPPCAQLA